MHVYLLISISRADGRTLFRVLKHMALAQGLEPDIEQMRRQHKDDVRHATQQAQEMAK